MITNYLRFAFRSLRRRKGFAILNIGGLVVGMTCSLLIGLDVLHQTSYDKHIDGAESRYRVAFHLAQGNTTYHEASVPFPAAEALQSEFPEIAEVVRVYREDDPPVVQVGNRRFAETRFYFADPGVVEMFALHVTQGRWTDDLNSVLLSRRMSSKYFGSVDPVGQVIRLVGFGDLRVVGVFEDSPVASHVHFDFVTPLQFQLNRWEEAYGQEGREKKWFWTGAHTYIRLQEPSHAAVLLEKLPGFVLRHFPERTRKSVTLTLQPLLDIHLHSQLDNELEPNGSGVYVWLFALIATVILLIACINFVNLTTAEAMIRARELGVRKIIGAQRLQIIGQVLCEAMTASGIAALITILCFEASAELYETVTGTTLALSIWNGKALGLIAAMSVSLGLLSGVYPALFLTRVNPLAIMKGTGSPFGRGGFRQVLVLVQFTISITLLIGIRVIDRQVDLFETASLGFDDEAVIMVKAQEEVNGKWEAFRTELALEPGITATTRMSNVPGEGAYVYRFVPEGGSIEKPASLPLMLIDYDFVQSLDLKMAFGRMIGREFPSDASEAFVINETAARQLGWAGQAVGKKLDLFAAGRNEIGKYGHVVGVIADYHFESLHHEVKPLVLTYADYDLSYYAIKIRSTAPERAISHLESVWKKFCPEKPIEFSFLNQRLDALYRAERGVSTLVRAFSILAVLISCLGLYGLSVHTAERRTKEIGIRKTLGASGQQIFALLSGGFLKPVVAANVIAWPVAYLAAHEWLEQFAYRVSVSPWDLVFGSVIGVVITLITVAYQTVAAAKANPVAALKVE